MRRVLPGAFSLVLVGHLLCSFPAAAFVGPRPGVSRSGGASLDPCQKKLVETLRFIEREREYASEKAKYREAAASRCADRKWYNLGFLEYALLVPVFGLVLPFFGGILLGSVRSGWGVFLTRAVK